MITLAKLLWNTTHEAPQDYALTDINQLLKVSK